MNSGTELRVLDVDETLTFKLRGMLICLMRNRLAADYDVDPKIRFFLLLHQYILYMDIYLTEFVRALVLVLNQFLLQHLVVSLCTIVKLQAACCLRQKNSFFDLQYVFRIICKFLKEETEELLCNSFISRQQSHPTLIK